MQQDGSRYGHRSRAGPSNRSQTAEEKIGNPSVTPMQNLIMKNFTLKTTRLISRQQYYDKMSQNGVRTVRLPPEVFNTLVDDTKSIIKSAKRTIFRDDKKRVWSNDPCASNIIPSNEPSTRKKEEEELADDDKDEKEKEERENICVHPKRKRGRPKKSENSDVEGFLSRRDDKKRVRSNDSCASNVIPSNEPSTRKKEEEELADDEEDDNEDEKEKEERELQIICVHPKRKRGRPKKSESSE